MDMGRLLAAQIEFFDGPSVVVSLDELAALPPARLAGAVIRLVEQCPCCGAWRAPTFMEMTRAAQGADQ